MKVLKFAKIDMMRVKRFSWMLLFPIIGILVSSGGERAVFGLGYSIFGGFMLSPVPFQMESRQENGLIKLLPARAGDAVRGHFLYSFLVLNFFFLAGIGGSLAGGLLGSGAKLSPPLACLIYGLMLLMAGVQNTVMSIFRFENAVATVLIRIIPAILFMSGGSAAGEGAGALAAGGMGDMLMSIPWGAIPLVCVLLYVLMAELSGRAASRR